MTNSKFGDKMVYVERSLVMVLKIRNSETVYVVHGIDISELQSQIDFFLEYYGRIENLIVLSEDDWFILIIL